MKTSWIIARRMLVICSMAFLFSTFSVNKPAEAALGFDFNEAMTPFWSSTTMYNESLLMVSNAGGLPEAPLLFTPITILSVKDAHLGIEYTQGSDWIYDSATNSIKLPIGSRAISMTTADLYPATSGANTQPKVGGGYVLFYEGHYFHDRQIVVTYTHSANVWNGPIPVYDAAQLPNTINKLQNGSPLKIVLYGDSISVGANASGYTGAAPYMPSWGNLVVQKLQNEYSSAITFVNPSVGGKDSAWGAANVHSLVSSENPDLVIIAFGMNDGTEGVTPTAYKSNIQTIMNDVKATNPNAEFILVATTLANPETFFAGQQVNYKPQLQSLLGTGIVMADMTGTQQELLNHKNFRDMTGNNVNHPNDFLVRWYAQIVSALLVDPGPDQIVKHWEFNSNGNLEGWTMTNQISGNVSGGVLTLISSGGDPYMISADNLGIANASANRYIKISLKNNTSATAAQFFFTTTSDTAWDAAKSVTFTTAANGSGYTEYIVDMGANSHWTGTIKQLRFDPFGATGTMNVDYIHVTNTGTSSGSDTTAPAAVTNLAVDSSASSSVTLTWTAPGDDGNTGTAASYDIRYSTSPITTANWASSTQATGEPAPAAAGTNQSYTVSGLSADSTYYFAIKTSDEAPNISDLCNVPNGTTAITGENFADEWGFAVSTGGWTNGNQAVQTLSGGVDTITSSGIDPYLYSSDNLNISASAYKSVKIRMKNNTASTQSQVFFTTTTDTAWSEAKSIMKAVSANDSGYTEYIFDFSANSAWAGTIKQLRWDPVAASGTVDADYIRVSNMGGNTPPFANPGFETPGTTTYIYGPMTNGWTFDGGSGVQHNGSAWGAASAPDGVQTAFLQSVGQMSQSVTFQAGTYSVGFKAAKRTISGGTQSFDVYYDSTLIGSFTPTLGSFTSFTTDSFTATAGSHTIKFVGTALGDNTDFIDSVSVN